MLLLAHDGVNGGGLGASAIGSQERGPPSLSAHDGRGVRGAHPCVELKEISMNTTENSKSGFFTHLMRDEGIQRALAGVAVAAVVAVAKEWIFGDNEAEEA